MLTLAQLLARFDLVIAEVLTEYTFTDEVNAHSRNKKCAHPPNQVVSIDKHSGHAWSANSHTRPGSQQGQRSTLIIDPTESIQIKTTQEGDSDELGKQTDKAVSH